ncbi:hypothetical protein AN958_07952 [Leucoagaricus sp. SymC.cos]|nr:hypothetical protein AN958_07952 [Leucoagaricus sp. SymC.cos]
MPLKGENPITTYFPRVTADLKLKTSIQPKLKVAKRLRQPDEPTSESSRKKSKSRRQAGVEYSPNFANSSCSVERTSCSKTPWAVIEIRNTPPSSPTRPPLIPQITPPSSPLPELTPSPEHPPRTQRPPSLYRVDDQEVDVGLSAILSVSGKASHQEHDEMKLDLIPSSQTQVLDILRDEDAELFQACDPPSSIPTRNSEWIIPSQTSVDILAPQRNQNPSLSHTVQEELVASSQSQLMDLIPTSPITFDPDMVPSSQTQEFSYSQNAYSSQRGTIVMCEMVGRLQNKVALVTGAASGIGLESSILFAQEGANVLLVDINLEGAQKGAKIIAERFPNVRATATRADVGKEADVKTAVDLAVKEFGRLDVMVRDLFCSIMRHVYAGVMHAQDDNALNTEERIWDLTMQINLKGVWWGCKYAILAMRQNPTDESKGLHTGGSIINTASFVALMGAATPQLAYTASKGGVLAMTRELAMVHAREGIRINSLCPGPLKTPLLMEFLDTDEKKQRRLVHLPMGRFGEAVELAKAALFLASDDSSYVTGTDFAVDGGLSKAYVTPSGEPALAPPSSLV